MKLIFFVTDDAEEDEVATKNTDGFRNLPVVTATTVLPTTWAFDEFIKPENLSVGGYIFPPKPSDTCSGVLVSKQSINDNPTSVPKFDNLTAGNLQQEYSAQACFSLHYFKKYHY